MKVHEIINEDWKEKLKSFFKKKELIKDDPRMMQEFEQHGGYEKLDVTGWQIGWKTCQMDPSGDPRFLFNKMYYGGSPVPFGEKSFYAGFNACAKSKGIKIYGDIGNSDITADTLKLKDLKNDKVLP